MRRLFSPLVNIVLLALQSILRMRRPQPNRNPIHGCRTGELGALGRPERRNRAL